MTRLLAAARHNLSLKAVSLLLALILWAWRSGEANPLELKTFPGLPVLAQGLPKGLLLLSKLEPVTVTLRGPRRTLDRLSQRHQVQPFVDCSAVEQPTWTLLKVEVKVPEGVETKSIEKTEALVEFDTYEALPRPVRADVGKSLPAPGYVSAVPHAELAQAEVRGPRKLVSRVAWLQASVDVSGLRGDASPAVRLVAMDAGNQRVSGVECQPVTVKVHVKIDRSAEVTRPADTDSAAPESGHGSSATMERHNRAAGARPGGR